MCDLLKVSMSGKCFPCGYQVSLLGGVSQKATVGAEGWLVTSALGTMLLHTHLKINPILRKSFLET